MCIVCVCIYMNRNIYVYSTYFPTNACFYSKVCFNNTMSLMSALTHRSKELIKRGNRSELPHPPLKPLLRAFVVMFLNLLRLATR